MVPAAGVCVDEGRVTGLLAVSSAGLRCVRGSVFVDATGDGDLAAWAGCPYEVGAGRDEMTLWFSFGKFHAGSPSASRHYHAVVDQRSLRDTTRAMILGRRQVGIFGEAEFPAFDLSVRESRHVRGGKTVSYLDMLRNPCYADTVVHCLVEHRHQGDQRKRRRADRPG